MRAERTLGRACRRERRGGAREDAADQRRIQYY